MRATQEIQLGEKYVLLDLIGIGGMAEVYRGKYLGDKGFEKQLVIKKLLPQIAKDQEMVRLFIGEARLAALLQHDNIAATYDFGEIDGNYFLAMEYLAGKDLYTVLQQSREKKSSLALKHALFIASKICEGMHYAHRLNDLKGKPLKIIHRDLTPHNIFITYDGRVKIFDFGVAKAEMLDNKTQVGVVKGKLSYMSPEQLSGDHIDFRSDIFSIGIMLYEMISGQRMYCGDTATLIRKCIAVEYEDLENVVPGLPVELYAILHKALARDTQLRYQSCGDMQADIEDLMFALAERQDSNSLQELIKTLFAPAHESHKNELVTDQEKTIALGPNHGRESWPWPVFFHSFKNLLWGNKQFVLAAVVCLAIVLIISRLTSYFTSQSATVTGTSIKELSQPARTTHSLDTISVVNKNQIEKNGNRFSVKNENAGKQQQKEPYSSKKRMEQTVDTYATKAEKALAKKNFSKAAELIERGLSEAPDHDLLLRLKSNVEIQKKETIRSLDRMAKKCIQQNKLLIPTGDSAYYFYKEIEKVEPGSMLTQNGMRTIGDRYAALADQSFRRFDLAGAEVYVTRGLKVVPSHTRLQQLRNDLRKPHPAKIIKGVEKNVQVFEKKLERFFGN